MDSDHDRERPESSENEGPRRLSRRRVLQATGGLLAAGGLAGLGGGYVLWRRRQRFDREPERTIGDHQVQWPATAPRMITVRGADPARNVRGLLERLGGLKQFVTPNDAVLIKPNVGWNRTPEQAANTDPQVVAELVRACRECRARRIVVCDCPVDDSKASFERSGIMRQAQAAGAEVVLPEDSRLVTVRLSERLGTWEVPEPFVQATRIINVPVAKHHDETAVTGGLKNWIGITKKHRFTFHNDIHQSIVELAALMRPTLTIIDASRVLVRNGPKGGSLADVKQMNTVATAVDPVALDAWACHLLGAADKLPKYVHLAQQIGLGQPDFGRLSPVEIQTG